MWKLSLLGLAGLLLLPPASRSAEPVALNRVRREVLQYLDASRVAGRPPGGFRARPGAAGGVTLYAACDAAIIRAVMGEDLASTLTATERAAWVEQILAFARPDGSFGPARRGHGLEHANGTVIGALGLLGGRQLRPVRFYESFDGPDEVGPWLDSLDWSRPWRGAHRVWGGPFCYSLSRRCDPAWRDAAFAWLDAELDSSSGWWRRGVFPQEAHASLGGAAHIWPFYQQHGRRFPYPERVIDSILRMQKPDGCWLEYGSYLELDALYGLVLMGSHAPGYRRVEILTAARRHGAELTARWPSWLAREPDLHDLLAVVGTFGLLQQLLPGEYVDEARWTDIFSDPRLCRTAAVEAP